MKRRLAREKKARLNEPIPEEKKNRTLLERFDLSFFDELKRRIEEAKRREG